MTLLDLLNDKRYQPEKRRLAKIREGMKQRCQNPNNPKYHLYGGKGVKVCDEWNQSRFGLYRFIEWSLSHGYMPTLTIDRIDPNGDYEPENCRWVTGQSNSMRCRDVSECEAIYRKQLAEQYPDWE